MTSEPSTRGVSEIPKLPSYYHRKERENNFHTETYTLPL
jgi:hypothetical protein